MKTTYFWIGICSIFLSVTTTHAQVKNKITETFFVDGNCGMCKNTIEKAGNKKSEAQVTWDVDAKKATIAYDPTKTNAEAVLKRIALAGYDNEKFLAPDKTYDQLHGCCQYERSLKGKSLLTTRNVQHNNHTTAHQAPTEGLETIVMPYLKIKDALVNANFQETSKQAKSLLVAIQQMELTSLPTEIEQKWSAINPLLTELATKIETSNNIEVQRTLFSSLSNIVYDSIKNNPLSFTLYYQNCPMYNNGKGANWLSLNKEINNPFYGSKMMTCGSTKETIE